MKNQPPFDKDTVLVPADQMYPNGALIVDGYDQQGNLLAHPQGGGFQLIITPAKAALLRPAGDTETESPVYRRGRFSIEGVEGEFEGWTTGESWNGWAMPAFEFNVAQEVAKAFDARYDKDRDCFITKSQDDEEEVWQAEEITLLGGTMLKVYPIGAGSWIWDQD